MKIIEAMKKTKDLQVKAEDLKRKVSTLCTIQSIETPLYGKDQAEKIKEWLQGYGDITKEILKLRVAIQRTNLATKVTIDLGGVAVTKSIAEWIHRRRDLAKMEQGLWESLTDRGLKEGKFTNSQGEVTEVKLVRYYDPNLRDKQIDLFRSEPTTIDSVLEVTNAITDIIEA